MAGLYVIPSVSMSTKLSKIKEKITGKCYDFYTQMGVRYFHRVF